MTATREEKGLPDESYTGLADASLSLRWTPWSQQEDLSGLALSLGLILPTGEAIKQPIVGVATPAVFQAGTGTVQATFGILYSRPLENWNFGLSFDSRFALHESNEDFRPASILFASLFAGRSLTETLDAKFSLDFFHGTRDQLGGQEIPFTGSTTLSLKPSLIWNINDHLATSASVSIPIQRQVKTTQLATGTLWSLGISYNF
ncbi:MAG: transporter [Verrucomicrobiota bacterium]